MFYDPASTRLRTEPNYAAVIDEFGNGSSKTQS
jgi:hypothetical protein